MTWAGFASRVFFFSSRRRHTRFKCDWSSDVCSSDLGFVAQITQRLRVLRHKPRLLGLALHLAHDNAQYRALPFDDFLQTPKLLGMRISACAAPQRFAFLGKSLFELNACALGRSHYLVARDLQQAAVYRVCDGLLLDCRVHNHPLKFFGFDGLYGHSSVDGGLE